MRSGVCRWGVALLSTISSHVHSVWNDLLVTNSAAQVVNYAKFLNARNRDTTGRLLLSPGTWRGRPVWKCESVASVTVRSWHGPAHTKRWPASTAAWTQGTWWWLDARTDACWPWSCCWKMITDCVKRLLLTPKNDDGFFFISWLIIYLLIPALSLIHIWRCRRRG